MGTLILFSTRAISFCQAVHNRMHLSPAKSFFLFMNCFCLSEKFFVCPRHAVCHTQIVVQCSSGVLYFNASSH